MPPSPSSIRPSQSSRRRSDRPRHRVVDPDKLPSRKLMGAGDAPLGTCPVRFDKMKGPFTELGKKCKAAAAAAAAECCDAFKAVACPHNKLLNDLDNGCGDDMFYFIQIYGRLPLGTIFKKCVEGPHGIKC